MYKKSSGQQTVLDGAGAGVTSVATSGAITGGTITSTGTITHSTSASYKHIPSGGSGSSGSRQVLTYSGSSGSATFQAASEHGTHGGGGSSGTVTSVAAGNGMNFSTITGTGTVTMRTPQDSSPLTSNVASSSGHTHTITGTGNNSYAHPDPITLDDGDSGVPTYTFSSDPDTGLYRYNANAPAMSAGGSTQMIWNTGVGGGWTYVYDNLKVYGSTEKTSSGGDWDVSSDDRIKTDVVSITEGLNTVASLNPISYKFTDEWKEAVDSTEHHTVYGYLASEFRTVFPNDTKDGQFGLAQKDGKWEYTDDPTIDADIKNLVTINGSSIVPHLVAAIKELKARIEVLEGNG